MNRKCKYLVRTKQLDAADSADILRFAYRDSSKRIDVAVDEMRRENGKTVFVCRNLHPSMAPNIDTMTPRINGEEWPASAFFRIDWMTHEVSIGAINL